MTFVVLLLVVDIFDTRLSVYLFAVVVLLVGYLLRLYNLVWLFGSFGLVLYFYEFPIIRDICFFPLECHPYLVL